MPNFTLSVKAWHLIYTGLPIFLLCSNLRWNGTGHPSCCSWASTSRGQYCTSFENLLCALLKHFWNTWRLFNLLRKDFILSVQFHLDYWIGFFSFCIIYPGELRVKYRYYSWNWIFRVNDLLAQMSWLYLLYLNRVWGYYSVHLLSSTMLYYTLYQSGVI